MTLPSSLRLFLATGMSGFFAVAAAQTRGPSGPPPKTGVIVPTTPTRNNNTLIQPTFVSGNVLLEGGGPPPEPVAIERNCNGMSRREGYTDSKGQFQIQVGQNVGFQDASESSSNVGLAPQGPQRVVLESCEFRAVLPGFESSTVLLRTHGNTGQFEVGTIFLKRLANVQGSTISMTTMSAPPAARSAYEKGGKALSQNKRDDAEKQLEKAVKLYPKFAAAWSLLGDIKAQKNNMEEATNDYSQALAADPQFVNPSYGLALIAMQEKRWSDAIHYTSEVLRLNSFAFPAAYFYNAVANYNSGQFGAAEDSARKFKAADSEHKHPDVCLLLSEILTRKQDYAGAAKEAREYLALAPNSPNSAAIREKAERLEQLSRARPQ